MPLPAAVQVVLGLITVAVDAWVWVVGSAAVIVLLAAVVLTARMARSADRDSTPDSDDPLDQSRPRAALVINPTKFDDEGRRVRSTVKTLSRDLGWASPVCYPTTKEDTGQGQTEQALGRGVDVVLACGGDGTVRAVATALSGTRTPLGLLPAGTGNLLARNIEMDLADMRAAVRTALTGGDRAVDVGVISLDDGPSQRFLVMAGMGFDADIMGNTSEQLKSAVGPLAYLVAGVQRLYGPRTKLAVGVDDRQARTRRARAIIVGNCGRLFGGIMLMPEAEIDDGLLDVVTLAPRGLVGWANLATAVLTRNRRGHPTLDRARGTSISIAAEEPMPVQIDGDPIGRAQVMRVWVEPGALRVRVKRP